MINDIAEVSKDILNDTVIDFVAGSFAMFASWFFGGLDGLLKVLLVMIVIDYFSGLSVAWVNGTISSSIGFKGITKKCIMLAFVGMAHLMDTIIPDSGGAMRYIVCLFYIANEGKSIIENASELGVPFPKALKDKFSVLKEHDKIAKKKKDE